MIILKFQTGVRVVVLTANFVSVDVSDKSQAVWYQDFRRGKSDTCDFEVRTYVCSAVGGSSFLSSLHAFVFFSLSVCFVWF